ncbi:TetR/AcrR family transcriptional regulator [Terracoccus sp. 273MFTsu3.1]|uniref:TetR/AcrR family transcriptional regulator n=1 Tax=Terracoccus sp. 273MFTsu3.1 TaxID=1172188 RepID=UPI00036E25FB|nr:ABC-F family ATP-binding cassette domain-containing protein [Terracoccus sp. 273MFTsu3.1]
MPPTDAPLSPRRRQLLEAAVAVVAAGGLRGLTHRAVDARAGLPAGTCSAYLRTRAALVHGLAQHVATGLTGDVEALGRRLAARPGDPAFASAQISDLFAGWLREPDVVLARLELTLEAARDDELAAAFAQWRDRLLDVVEEVVGRSRDTDARPHAEAVVASLEGVLLSALAQPARRRRAYVTRTVDAVLTAFAESPG